MIKNFLISLLVLIQPENIKTDIDDQYYEQFEDKIYPLSPTGLKASYHSSVVIFSTTKSELLGEGSGNYFKIDKSFFILTAYHVVSNGEVIYVGEKNGDISVANIVYFDKENDIAILKTNKQLKGTKAIKFKDNEKMFIGEKIFHTSNPDGEAWYISDGIIAKINKDRIMLNTFAWPGSSGAVVFNKNGNPIGIITSVKISYPLGFPDVIEHIVVISNINNISKETILLALNE